MFHFIGMVTVASVVVEIVGRAFEQIEEHLERHPRLSERVTRLERKFTRHS